jgi:hypothetical protein
MKIPGDVLYRKKQVQSIAIRSEQIFNKVRTKLSISESIIVLSFYLGSGLAGIAAYMFLFSS